MFKCIWGSFWKSEVLVIFKDGGMVSLGDRYLEFCLDDGLFGLFFGFGLEEMFMLGVLC